MISGMVSILPKSDNGVWASEKQVGIFSSLWSSFFSGPCFLTFMVVQFYRFKMLHSSFLVVHLSPNCGFDCPSSPSSVENKTAIGYSSFCQFPGLCSHGSSSLANTVTYFFISIVSCANPEDVQLKCDLLLFVQLFHFICRSQQYFLLANEIDLGDELEEFDEAPHNVENRQAPFIRKNSRSLSDSDVFSTHDLANQRIAVWIARA